MYGIFGVVNFVKTVHRPLHNLGRAVLQSMLEVKVFIIYILYSVIVMGKIFDEFVVVICC